jgi:hypothetical protein
MSEVYFLGTQCLIFEIDNFLALSPQEKRISVLGNVGSTGGDWKSLSFLLDWPLCSKSLAYEVTTSHAPRLHLLGTTPEGCGVPAKKRWLEPLQRSCGPLTACREKKSERQLILNLCLSFVVISVTKLYFCAVLYDKTYVFCKCRVQQCTYIKMLVAV